MPSQTPILEWRKILAMIPEDILQQTIKNINHFYVSVEEENQQDPRRHHRYILYELIHPRQRETFASEDSPPTAK